MIIHLIRHGLSIANEKRLVTGAIDDPLSEDGKKQVFHLASWLSQRIDTVDHFYCSPWLRAQQTANILAPSALWRTEARLGETNAGKIADKPLNEFIQLHPNFYDSPENRYPDGESHLELNQRVISWLEEISNAHQAKRNSQNNFDPEITVLAVTHAGPIACIFQHIFEITMTEFPAHLAGNATITSFHVPDNKINNARVLCISAGPDSEICMKAR